MKKIVAQLKDIAPTSREHMISLIRQIISDTALPEIIDTHNTQSVIFIFSTSINKYLLKAEYGSNSATANEIAWYKMMPQKNSPAPKLISSYSKHHYALFISEYIEDSKTLDELVEMNAITNERLHKNTALLRNKQIFDNSKPSKAQVGQLNKFYLKKYYQRSSESKKFNYLKSLLETPGYSLNGKAVHAPVYYLRRIANDDYLRKYLTTSNLGLIHGDLHTGNILVRNNALYLIDPNSAFRMPLEYDYGKLFHSIHGGYNSIMKGCYSLEILDSITYQFDVQIPDLYKDEFRKLEEQLTDQEFLRGLYSEAVHFATLLPHHATNQIETTALFLRSIQIFEELFYNMDIR